MKKTAPKKIIARRVQLPADPKKESRMFSRFSLVGVMLLLFISGWTIGQSKIPHNPNDPRYEVALANDPDGTPIIAVREWRDSKSPWTPVYKVPAK